MEENDSLEYEANHLEIYDMHVGMYTCVYF